jgi:Tfp pilus assembly protein PilN
VITQFVVICVFFYRFKVDQEIVDLKDGLVQKKQIVEATDTMLKEISYLESKTTNIKDILTKQDSFYTAFNYFTQSIPSDIVITSIVVVLDTIECEGLSVNPASIQNFQQQLVNEKRFENVELYNVRKTDTGFIFGLKLINYQAPVSAT